MIKRDTLTSPAFKVNLVEAHHEVEAMMVPEVSLFLRLGGRGGERRSGGGRRHLVEEGGGSERDL